MTILNTIIKRAMSLMKAHVQYSQSLATEFSHLIKDYEDLVQAPEIIELDAQEEVELEAVCAEFEELMDNEPIAVLRSLRPYGVEVNTEKETFKHPYVEVIANNFVEKSLHLCSKEVENRRSRRIKKRKGSCKNISKNLHPLNALYPSTICSKRSTNKISMKSHTTVHTGEKPYNCTFCSKKFSQKSYLKDHTRVHTREKPYKCGFCKKRFTGKSNLKRHTRIHTGERPYECTICSKNFLQKYHLNQHVKKHT